MDVILICLHTPDIPVMFGASIKHVLFNVCSERTEQQGFAILCRRDQMYHEQILVMPPMLINVIHTFVFSLYILYNIYIVKLHSHGEELSSICRLAKRLKYA